MFGYSPIGFALRLVESVNVLLWAVLIFLKIAYETDRYVYLALFGFHVAVSLATFDFVQERLTAPELKRGLWFYLYLIFIGMIADVSSFAELIQHCVWFGFSKIEIAEMVMWSLTVLIDIAYISWALIAFLSAKPRGAKKITN